MIVSQLLNQSHPVIGIIIDSVISSLMYIEDNPILFWWQTRYNFIAAGRSEPHRRMCVKVGAVIWEVCDWNPPFVICFILRVGLSAQKKALLKNDAKFNCNESAIDKNYQRIDTANIIEKGLRTTRPTTATLCSELLSPTSLIFLDNISHSILADAVLVTEAAKLRNQLLIVNNNDDVVYSYKIYHYNEDNSLFVNK